MSKFRKSSAATAEEVIAHGRSGYAIAVGDDLRRTHPLGSEAHVRTAAAWMDAYFTADVVRAAANETPPFYGRCSTKAEALVFLARHIERVYGPAIRAEFEEIAR